MRNYQGKLAPDDPHRVTHIRFSSGAVVLLSEAIDHYDNALGADGRTDRRFDGVVGAHVVDDRTGRTFETYAKDWSIWCPKLQRHVCARIGVGAYGETVVAWRDSEEINALTRGD